MVPGSAVVLCGQISAYNTDAPYPPPLRPEVQRLVTERGISRERYLVLEYQDKFADGVAQLARWLAAGAIKVRGPSVPWCVCARCSSSEGVITMCALAGCGIISLLINSFKCDFSPLTVLVALKMLVVTSRDCL